MGKVREIGRSGKNSVLVGGRENLVSSSPAPKRKEKVSNAMKALFCMVTAPDCCLRMTKNSTYLDKVGGRFVHLSPGKKKNSGDYS
ncbi:hypothetical protein [Candidatus Neptunochlamydia vexilliferae]|uniref:hypothetical protein n=1 Tax=Candidatus Neptunichlamydia vexilliferae TaxID=1651774 RepID=UPI001890EF9F|nr:hypothetical protein [Candidatus Neptunochlamydia vexilliferae]